jgi:hypothetical protein
VIVFVVPILAAAQHIDLQGYALKACCILQQAFCTTA